RRQALSELAVAPGHDRDPGVLRIDGDRLVRLEPFERGPRHLLAAGPVNGQMMDHVLRTGAVHAACAGERALVADPVVAGGVDVDVRAVEALARVAHRVASLTIVTIVVPFMGPLRRAAGSG